jgi:hypothetical protein
MHARVRMRAQTHTHTKDILEHTTKACGWLQLLTYAVLNLSTRWRYVIRPMSVPLHPMRETTVPNQQEKDWAM